MAHYECMMILNPTAGEEAINGSIDAVKKSLTDLWATLNKDDVWGEKKMAYKIKGSDTGYYILLDLEVDGKGLKSLNTNMNLDKNLWRYMFVNLDA